MGDEPTDPPPQDAPPEPPEGIDEETEERYVRGVLARGEAAKADEHGNLPPGVTHEIVEEREGELPKIRRRRYSAY